MRGVLKAGGKKVTLMGILVKTFSMAMRTHPKINATYEPHKDPFAYTLYSGHHISVAIDSANGLVVPNIKNVQFLSLTAIQIEL